MQISGGRRRAIGTVLAVAAALTITSHETRTAPTLVRSGRFTSGSLTPDGSDQYQIAEVGAGFTVTAPSTNSGGNLRVAVIRDDAVMAVDEQSCVTWVGPNTGSVQPGLTLRTQAQKGRTRAIMITNNIWYGARFGFDVHLADSAAFPQFVKIGGAELTSALGGIHDLSPLPWRICARVVGTTLDVKVWPMSTSKTEPSWGNPKYGFTMEIPADWVFAGRPGAYIGHLRAGDKEWFSELRTATTDGTPANAWWNDSLAWSDHLSRVARGRPALPAEQRDLATGVTLGHPAAGATLLAASPDARRFSARLIDDELAPDGASPLPTGGRGAGGSVADLYAARTMVQVVPASASDSAFVTATYRAVLGREPTRSELRAQVRRLAHGRDRTALARGVYRSVEHARRAARENGAAVFGRPATAAEVRWYAMRLPELGFDPARLRADMALSLVPTLDG
ncbi:DUF4214 domain-containing protein [Aquihabitans sp. McL0605]|uniref:DUF4214 domain-containing protein n=1 Tax=Aquihabitans sp. McL0605 TaxID=3415671 RepID=UPI003CEDA1E4